MLTRRLNLIELAAVLIVVTVAVYALFSRTLRYLEAAEKAAMTISVLEVERGIRIRLALAAMRGAPVPPASLQHANPFEFAHAIPPNYLGEVGGQTDRQGLRPGNWFFDKDRDEIAYLPRLSSRFRGGEDASIPMVRFRVVLAGGKSALPSLVPVTAYQWEPEFGGF